MGTAMVIGVDAGATTTRCVVATAGGTVVGRGVAGGANRNSSGGDVTAVLSAAITAALGSLDRSTIAAGVLGAAGSSGAGRAAFRSAAETAWRAAGLTAEMTTVTDLEVAFAAGTPEPGGVLLLSGTGALAARFAGHVLDRRCDGYGWLLGDEGSAVWIAVRALRAVLAALDGRGAPTLLTEAARLHFGVAAPHADSGTAAPRADFDVAGSGAQFRSAASGIDFGTAVPGGGVHPEHTESGNIGIRDVGSGGAGPSSARAGSVGNEEIAQALIAATFAMPPAELGRFAPVVSAAAEEDDAVAARICAAATGRLLHTFDSVDPPSGAVVVLAGSVLLSPGPIARQVRAGLLARTGTEPRRAHDGAAGAAALAISRITGAPVAPVIHAGLMR